MGVAGAHLTRRVFMITVGTAICGLTVLRPLVAKMPRVVDWLSQGDPNATWRYRQFTEWVRMHDSYVLACQLLAERSDGAYFYVTGCIPGDVLSLPSDKYLQYVNNKRMQMEISLNKNLHCACSATRPCLKHSIRQGVA